MKQIVTVFRRPSRCFIIDMKKQKPKIQDKTQPIGFAVNSPEVHFFIRDQHIKSVDQHRDGDIHIKLHNGETLIINRNIETDIKSNKVVVNISNYCTMIRK